MSDNRRPGKPERVIENSVIGAGFKTIIRASDGSESVERSGTIAMDRRRRLAMSRIDPADFTFLTMTTKPSFRAPH